LAGGAALFMGGHVPQGLDHAAQAHPIFEAFGCFWLFEHGEQMAKLAQVTDIVHAHAQGDATRGAKQIAKHRDVVAGGVFEQQGRSTGAQGAVAQGSHF